MKTNLYTILLLITWILATSLPIDAYLYCPPNKDPVDSNCYKRNEIYKTPIRYRACGDALFQVYKLVCDHGVRVKRTASDVLLGKERANRFLSSHHRTKRSGFNAVEECCKEGCLPEELYEYCKPY